MRSGRSMICVIPPFTRLPEPSHTGIRHRRSIRRGAGHARVGNIVVAADDERVSTPAAYWIAVSIGTMICVSLCVACRRWPGPPDPGPGPPPAGDAEAHADHGADRHGDPVGGWSAHPLIIRRHDNVSDPSVAGSTSDRSPVTDPRVGRLGQPREWRYDAYHRAPGSHERLRHAVMPSCRPRAH